MIRLDQTLSCWGPLAAHVPTGTFRQVAVSGYYGCALASDGTAVCWNEYGASFSPEDQFSQLASDGSRVCGLRTGGITCWDRDTVTATFAGSFTEIFVEGRVCARTTGGMPTCWDPDPAFAPEPFLQLLPDLGGGCALRTDGTLNCVEETSSLTNYDAAQAVFLRADAADDNIVALRPDGRTVQWRAGMMTFPAPGQHFIDVRAILTGGCGLKADRKVYCWGTTAYPRE